MFARKRSMLLGMALALGVAGSGVALSSHLNLNQAGPFRARFINETGTDIILVLESPEPGVGLTLNLEEGKRSGVIPLRGGNRPLMAWDDTTLEIITLFPLKVDQHMRIHVRRTPFASPALAPGTPPVAEPADNP